MGIKGIEGGGGGLELKSQSPLIQPREILRERVERQRERERGRKS